MAESIDGDLRQRYWALAQRGVDLPDFDELLQRPTWHLHAACRGLGTDRFFPPPGGSARSARQICDSCEVRAECQAAGATHGGGYGIWGGLPAAERQRGGRRRRGTAA